VVYRLILRSVTDRYAQSVDNKVTTVEDKKKIRKILDAWEDE
jgi:hypothetical protein